MTGRSQQFSPLAVGQVVFCKEFKIVVGQLKIAAFLGNFQHSVCGSGCNVVDIFSDKQIFELFNVKTSESLFSKVYNFIIFIKI